MADLVIHSFEFETCRGGVPGRVGVRGC